MDSIKSINAEVSRFLDTYLSVPSADQITLFAILMDQMQHGFIRQEDGVVSNNRNDPDRNVLSTQQLGLGSGTWIACELMSKVGKAHGKGKQMDTTWIYSQLTDPVKEMQETFYNLCWADKLTVLGSFFCLLEGNMLQGHRGSVVLASVPRPGKAMETLLHLRMQSFPEPNKQFSMRIMH